MGRDEDSKRTRFSEEAMLIDRDNYRIDLTGLAQVYGTKTWVKNLQFHP